MLCLDMFFYLNVAFLTEKIWILQPCVMWLTSDSVLRRLKLSVLLRPGGVKRGRVICPVGVTGLLLERLYIRSGFPWLVVGRERIMRLLGVCGLLGVWARLQGLLGDCVRLMMSGSRGVLLGELGLELKPGMGSALALWGFMGRSRLLWGLMGLLLSFPCSASLAKSFSTSGGNKSGLDA